MNANITTRHRDGKGRFVPRVDMSKMPKRARTDSMSSMQDQRTRTSRSQLAFGSGWLYPQMAWATYSQNGVVKHLITRIATLMLSKPWSYQGSDVRYEWSTIMSLMETMGVPSALRSAVIWMMIFGGSGLVIDADDAFRSWEDELDIKKLRKINSFIPKTAVSLKPYPMQENWNTCEYFYDQYAQNEKKRIIHRSRVIPIVAHDTPPDLGYWGSQVYNNYTGWPPSWIEGIYDALCEWKGADKNVGTIIRTMSLLYLKIAGFRKAQTAPNNSPEVIELENMLDSIAENLDNEGLLTIDVDDSLGEVGRNTAGLDRLLQEKKTSFVAATGVPKELVLMESVGNLGDNSGPIDAYNQFVDGMRTDTLVAPLIRITDLLLAVQAKNEPTEQYPKQYTVKFAPLAEQSGKEQADQRDKESHARERDLAFLPPEVVASDPSLNVYADMPKYREQQAEKAEAAKLAAAGVEVDPMSTGELESAASIAAWLSMKPATVLALRARGVIEGRKIGGRWKFHRPTVWAALKGENKAELAQEIEEIEEAPTADRFDSGLGLSESDHFGSVFGNSVAMREIFAVLERVAPSKMSVLLSGETGTGKEGIARGLYEVGGSRGKMVSLNCGALPQEPDRVLDVLTDHIKRAASGTLFLDEVGELPGTSQAAMLRAIADADNVRIIAATWQDLGSMWFRRDLHTRLAQIEVEIPPLREREEDVIELGLIFYKAYVSSAGAAELSTPFTSDALSAMRLYSWPGNVRELKNAVERGALFAGNGKPISAENLALPLGRRA
jgi:phage-related protein (TIGR01555 family)